MFSSAIFPRNDPYDKRRLIGSSVEATSVAVNYLFTFPKNLYTWECINCETSTITIMILLKFYIVQHQKTEEIHHRVLSLGLAPPQEPLHEARDAPLLLLHPVSEGRELHVVQGQVKEQWLAGDGAVVRGEGGQGDLLGGRSQDELVGSFC